MSRWLGRPAGRHAAGGRGRAADSGSGPANAARADEAPASPVSPANAGVFGAPTMADAPEIGRAHV